MILLHVCTQACDVCKSLSARIAVKADHFAVYTVDIHAGGAGGSALTLTPVYPNNRLFSHVGNL